MDSMKSVYDVEEDSSLSLMLHRNKSLNLRLLGTSRRGGGGRGVERVGKSNHPFGMVDAIEIPGMDVRSDMTIS